MNWRHRLQLLPTAALGLLITLACGLRFVGLDQAPPGFFYDEATGAAHAMCYQQTGRDLFGERGMFSRVDFSGFQSAPFILGSAAWTAVAGTDPAGFRGFVACVGVLTVLGVGVLARRLSGEVHTALWVAAIAACLPWAFQFSRVSWDAPLGVCLLVWGLALALGRPRDINSDPKLADPKLDVQAWATWLAAGLLLTLASYTYSPLRLQTGALVVGLMLLPTLSWRAKATVLAVFTLGNLPVLWQYQDPEFASRAQLLALTSDDPRNPFRELHGLGLLPAYLQQMAAHLTPAFLFETGDANLRHGIGTHGVLNGVTGVGVVLGLSAGARAGWRRLRSGPAIDGRQHPSQGALIALALLGILTGLSAAALTWDSTPHALRSIGAWPFVALLAGFGLAALPRHPAITGVGVALLAVLFVDYTRSFYGQYPDAASWWYDVEIRQQIETTGTFPNYYLPVARSYYYMTTFGQSCAETRTALGIVTAGGDA